MTVSASAAVKARPGADPLDSRGRRLKARVIDVETPVSVKVGRGSQENSRDSLEGPLSEALLAAVLQETLTLDRVRPDPVIHDVRHLPE
jgi:hypothetical protein